MAEMLASPTPRLFVCNEPPSHAERMAILNYINDIEAQIYRLTPFDKRSSVLLRRSSISCPPHVAKIVQSYASARLQHRLLLIGVRGLPTEVLEMIFHATVKAFDARSRHQILLTMMQTCRGWRDLIMHSPLLWSHFPDVFFATYDGDKWSVDLAIQQRRMIECFIQRSRDHPLTFRFRQPEYRKKGLDTGMDMELARIFSLLGSQSHRWKDVELFVTYRSLKAMSIVPSTLFLLESLTLTLWIQKRDPNSLVIREFSTCPNLRHATVRFRDSHLKDRVPPRVAIPWSQLHTFEDHTWGGFHQIVSQDEADSVKITMLSGSDQKLSTNFLTALDLKPSSSVYASQLYGEWFSKLHLPILEHLSFSPSTLTLEDVYLCIKRSRCPLKSLHMSLVRSHITDDYPAAPSITISHVLELCTNLEELQCTNCPIPTTDTLQKLLEHTFIVDEDGNFAHKFVSVPKLVGLGVYIPQRPADLSPDLPSPLPDFSAFGHLAYARTHHSRGVSEDGIDVRPKFALDFEIYDKPVCRDALHELVSATLLYTIQPSPILSTFPDAEDADATMVKWHRGLVKVLKKQYTKPGNRADERKRVKPYHDMMKEMEEYPVEIASMQDMLSLRVSQVLFASMRLSLIEYLDPVVCLEIRDHRTPHVMLDPSSPKHTLFSGVPPDTLHQVEGTG